MSHSLAGNISISMFSNAFYLLSRLVLPPLILSYLPLAEYGLWSICFVLIMYIGLVDAGFSTVYVRQVAIWQGQGNLAAINRLLSTGVMCLSLLAMLAWTILYLLLPHLMDSLSIAAEQRVTAQVLIPATAAMFLLDLSLGAYCYLLHGLQRIREEKQVAIAGYLLEPCLIWLFLHQGFGIYGLLLAFALRYLWSLSAFICLAHRFLPGLQLRPQHFDRSLLPHFFGFGLGVQLSTLISTALFSLDRMMAACLMGPKGAAIMDLANKLPVSALTIPSAIAQVTLPAAAQLIGQQRQHELVALSHKTTRAVAILASWPLAFMALFSAEISQAWLGAQTELQLIAPILSLTAIWCHLHISSGPSSAVFRALGQLGNDFVYHGLRIICLVLSGVLLISEADQTLLALAYALCLGNGIAAVLYLFYNQYRLGLGYGLLCREVFFPATQAYLLAAVLLPLLPSDCSRSDGLLWLILLGALYSLLWAALMWRQLHPHEQQRLHTLFAPFYRSFKLRSAP